MYKTNDQNKYFKLYNVEYIFNLSCSLNCPKCFDIYIRYVNLKLFPVFIVHNH